MRIFEKGIVTFLSVYSYVLLKDMWICNEIIKTCIEMISTKLRIVIIPEEDSRVMS